MMIGKYELKRTIGEGMFAKVKLGVEVESNATVAVKVVDKKMVIKNNLMHQVKREISTMKLLDHPNIVKIREVIATKTKIYLVMEYVAGGQLSDKLNYLKKIDEKEARKYFHQLIDAVDYCHSRGVYHRDLKPENLLLDNKGNLKVSDFGLSVLKNPGDLLSTACGSPSYVAPEVITHKSYDGAAADIWSCGVILFELLAGFLPFRDQSLTNLYRKIAVADYIFPVWFTRAQKKLISNILEPLPAKASTRTCANCCQAFSVVRSPVRRRRSTRSSSALRPTSESGWIAVEFRCDSAGIQPRTGQRPSPARSRPDFDCATGGRNRIGLRSKFGEIAAAIGAAIAAAISSVSRRDPGVDDPLGFIGPDCYSSAANDNAPATKRSRQKSGRHASGRWRKKKINNKLISQSHVDTWQACIVAHAGVAYNSKSLSLYIYIYIFKILNIYFQRARASNILEEEWFKVDYRQNVGLDCDENSSQSSSGETQNHGENNSWRFINAFQLIAMSNDLDLSGLFQEEEEEKIKLASEHPVDETFAKIEVAAKDVDLSVKRINNSRVKLHVSQGLSRSRSHYSLSAEVVEVTPKCCVIEVSKSAGDLGAYKEFCQSLSSLLKEDNSRSTLEEAESPKDGENEDIEFIINSD